MVDRNRFFYDFQNTCYVNVMNSGFIEKKKNLLTSKGCDSLDKIHLIYLISVLKYYYFGNLRKAFLNSFIKDMLEKIAKV